MNKNKQAYDRPTTDILVIRFESALLTGSPNSVNSTNSTEYLLRSVDDDDVDIL